MDDVNERVKREWKADTTGRQRVREVIEETTEPTGASEIASRALVSEPTARKYLNEFVDEGIASTGTTGRTTTYRRNERRVVDERIEELRTTRTRQELLEGIRGMSERIEEFRETYGVGTPEDLAVELEPGDEGWDDLGAWRATQRNLAIAKAALQVDEAHRLAEA